MRHDDDVCYYLFVLMSLSYYLCTERVHHLLCYYYLYLLCYALLLYPQFGLIQNTNYNSNSNGNSNYNSINNSHIPINAISNIHINYDINSKWVVSS